MLEQEMLKTDWIGIEQTIIDQAFRKAWFEWEQKFKSYLEKNLKTIGYFFETEEKFTNFFKEKVTRIVFEDKPNYQEFYINYVNQENSGTLIGICSDKIEIINKDNKFTILIG